MTSASKFAASNFRILSAWLPHHRPPHLQWSDGLSKLAGVLLSPKRLVLIRYSFLALMFMIWLGIHFVRLGRSNECITPYRKRYHIRPYIWSWSRCFPEHWAHLWKISCLLVSQYYRAETGLPKPRKSAHNQSQSSRNTSSIISISFIRFVSS